MQFLGDKDKSQIDLYDTFGYLVPGAILVFFSMLSILAWHNVGIDQALTFISNVSATLYITSIIFLLTASYIGGHLIASIAEIIFDRIFVGKIFEYPYINLFFEKNRSKNKANFYRAFITLVYVECIAVSLIPYTNYNFIPYLASLIPSFTIIFLLLRWLQKIGIKHKNAIKPAFLTSSLRTISHVLNIFAFILSRPFALLENFLNKLLGFDSAFPEKIKENFRDKFSEDFGELDKDEMRSEIYWLPYWKVTEESEHMRERLNKFLSLYGMMRNSSVSLFVSAMILSLPGFFYKVDYHLPYIGTALLVLSVVLSIRYYYIYYHYYSKSVFRTYLIMKN